MTIIGVVISYYPDTESFIKNIDRYADLLDELVVWENTPEQDSLVDAHLFVEKSYADKIRIWGEGDNKGISQVLNKVVDYALQNEYRYLLTMDQDSRWENFDFFINKIRMLDIVNIAQYTPELNQIRLRNDQLRFVDYKITSGSVFDLLLIQQVGKFREDFSVDGIDLDYGYRITGKGLQIVEIGEALLTQQFGKKIKLFHKKEWSSYSAQRLYDIVRTHLILFRDYYPRSMQMLKDLVLIYYIKYPLLILLSDNQKGDKLRAIWKGTIAGIKYRCKR